MESAQNTGVSVASRREHGTFLPRRRSKRYFDVYPYLFTDGKRLESMKTEVGALHEAMAGLHGEMGAVQRELDVAKTSQDKLTRGVTTAVHLIQLVA